MPAVLKVESMDDLWSKVTDTLKERIGPQNFDIWIKPIQLLLMDNDRVEMEVPNRFFREWIQEHYLGHMKEVFTHLTQRSFHLQFRIKNDPAEKKGGGRGETSSPQENHVPQVPRTLKAPFNPKYSFDNFVVGASNQFANAACLAVANLPAKNYNPLLFTEAWGWERLISSMRSETISFSTESFPMRRRSVTPRPRNSPMR